MQDDLHLHTEFIIAMKGDLERELFVHTVLFVHSFYVIQINGAWYQHLIQWLRANESKSKHFKIIIYFSFCPTIFTPLMLTMLYSE